MPQQRKTEYLLIALIALIILAYLALYSFIDFGYFPRVSTSDMYEDTLAARLMWEQKSLFPKSYLFGNQFYVVATPVLSALFYGLTGSMNRAMAWATACMSLLLLWSMEWMLRPCVKRLSLRLMALLVFMASVFGPYTIFREDGQQLFFAMCSFYACYLICFFVVLGDFARARESEELRLPPLLLSVFLCFCTGMQSLRQTCVLILPLLCYEGLYALRRIIKREKPWPKGKRMRLWRVLAYTAANLLGLVFIRLLPVRHYEIYGGASIFSGASFADKFRDMQYAIVTVTGYDYTREGENRLFFILMFLSLMLLVLGAVWLLLRRRRSAGPGDAGLFWLVAALGCLAVIAASFVTSVQLRPIYLFLWYTLPALSLVLISQRVKPKLLNAAVGFLCVLCAANLYFSYRDDVRLATSPEPTPAQQICDWALENGYELVYGNQSICAPYVAVCSDGKLIAGCWEDDNLFHIIPYINIRDVYSLNDAERACFVFLESELPVMREKTEEAGIEMTARGQYGPYYVYTADRQCLWPLTETIDYVPEYN